MAIRFFAFLGIKRAFHRATSSHSLDVFSFAALLSGAQNLSYACTYLLNRTVWLRVRRRARCTTTLR